MIASEFGYNLGGLVTGLGIGSVVVALAAQDIAKSMLAGLSIFSDRPFAVGDFIEVNGISGTVENMNFRSTKIRNADNQLIIIPNSTLVSSNIVNGSQITKRRYSTILTLELNTPLDKVENLSTSIKNYLTGHEGIIQDSVNIHFSKISDNGIDLNISFYSDVLDSGSFLYLKDDINYGLLSLIINSHIELAYPSQSIYLKK